MQTMRREGLADMLTNDRHFLQEGFRARYFAHSVLYAVGSTLNPWNSKNA
jgi:hypothetical protein